MKLKCLQQISTFSVGLLSVFLIGCNNDPIKLTNTKWKVIRITLDDVNSLNKNEIVAFNMTDSLLKSRNLYSEYKDGYVIMWLDGKVPDTTNYVIKNDTIFYIQKNLKDTSIILEKTDKTLFTKSLRGVATQERRVNQ